METKEFKRITKYDKYAVNDFVIGYKEAEKDKDNKNAELDTKIEEVDSKISELNSKNTKNMTPEDKESHKAKKEELRKEKSGYNKEKTQVKNSFAKWEKEKARIKERLNKDIEKIETKIKEKKTEKEKYEEEIKANEEKLDVMDKKLPEYDELVLAKRALERKVSSLKGAITKYENKIADIREIEGNLDTDNPLDLKRPIKNQPNKDKKKYKTNGERYKEYLEEKAKRTGYYADARTSEEDANFRTLVAEEKKIKENLAKNTDEAETKTTGNETIELDEIKQNSTKTGEVKPGATKTGEVKPGAAKTGEVKPGATKTGEEKPGAAKTGEVKPGAAKTREVKPGATKTGEVKPDATKTGEAKPESKKTVETEQEIKWHKKLTQDQIEELIAEGLEPGDNEYNLYLWNHGINPFEKEVVSEQESKWHKKLTQEQIEELIAEGIEPGDNEYALYLWNHGINPFENEASNNREEEKDDDESYKDFYTFEDEDKREKEPLLKRIWSKIKDIWNIIQKRIDNFDKKLLGDGKGSTKTKSQSKRRTPVISKAKSTAASLGRETRGTLRIIGTKISGYFRGENKMETEMKVHNIRSESFVPKAEVDERKARLAAEIKSSKQIEHDEATK